MIVQRMRATFTLPLFAAACVKQLPPAPIPPATPPPIAQTPVAEGSGRLVVDVVDGPTTVQRVRMQPTKLEHGFRFVEVPEVLCASTPCVTDVPTGNLLLGFPVIGRGDMEVELVHIGPEPSAYRRALSEYHDDTGALRVLGIIAASLGGASAITGTCLLPIGLSKDNDSLTWAGGITLGAGAVLLAIGIWAINTDAPTYRPGSSNHFPLR
jgi:hypothetical protein